MNLGATLKVGLVAGLVAGLVLGTFLVLVMGPLIDQAETLEGEENPVPVLQRRAAAFGGALFIGILAGLGFALAFPAVNLSFPQFSVMAKAMAFGLLAFVVFSLLPLLAVPATPPAVEMSPGVEERGFWFVATTISAFGGVLAAFGLYYLVSPWTKNQRSRAALALGGLAIVAFLWVLPFLLKPEVTALPGAAPQSLIDSFYTLTIVSWIVFWAFLSLGLGLIWPRFQSSSTSEGTELPA